ncbi:Alanine--tRNA ligase [Bienertia sinuspersici]
MCWDLLTFTLDLPKRRLVAALSAT